MPIEASNRDHKARAPRAIATLDNTSVLKARRSVACFAASSSDQPADTSTFKASFEALSMAPSAST